MRHHPFLTLLSAVITGTILTVITLAAVTALYSLSSYPEPFITNGVPAENLVIVVGDEAAASDVSGAIDVAIDLQGSSFVQKPTQQPSTTQSQQVFEGDAAAIGSISDLLEINEPIGNVREALTEVDLDMLKGGQIVTQRGATEYNQYLRFPSGNNTGGGRVIYGKDERGKVGHYLFINKNDVVFQWELEFETGLRSKIENGDLVDLEDEDVLILGMPFVIADTDFFVVSDTVLTPFRAKIQFLGGAVSAVLGENDKDTFIVDGKEYVIEVLTISETNDGGEGSVKFRINGEITKELSDGDSEVLSDGTQIGIRDIMPSKKNIQKSAVQFYLGAYSIEMTDINSTDNLNQSAGTKVNQNVIQDSSVRIKGQVFTNNTFQLERIVYSLFANSVLGDIYVPPGAGVREQLQEPEGMLTPAWDIVYQGLSDVPTTTISLPTAGTDEYNLEFSNQEDALINFPLISNANGVCKFGDDDDDLWFCEPSSISTFRGTFGDYFTFGNCDFSSSGDTQDDNCISHVCQYIGSTIPDQNQELATPGNRAQTPTITFRCEGEGEKVVQMTEQSSSSYSGYLPLEIGQCLIHADTIHNSPPNISVDLNCDGATNGGCADMGGMGQAILRLGVTNVPGDIAGVEGVISNVTGNTTNLSIVTLRSQFDSPGSRNPGTHHEQIRVELECRPDNKVGIKRVVNQSGLLFGPFSSDANPKLKQALSGYGAFFTLFDDGEGAGNPERFIVEYPSRQRGAYVSVLAKGSRTKIVKGGETFSQTLSPFTQTISRLASEVTDITQHHAIVVGGPCANTVSAQLLGNPDPCWEAVPEQQGLVQAFEQPTGNLAILIAGRTAQDTRLAAKALATRQFTSIDAPSAKTAGTTYEDITVEALT